MLAVAVLGPLFLFVALWLLSGAGSDDAPIVALWLGSIGTLVVIALAVQRANRCPLRVQVACSSLAIVAVAALGYWTVIGGLSITKLRFDESSWQQSLKAIDDGRSIEGCEIPRPTMTVAAIGTIDQICATSPPTGLPRAITFISSPNGTNLIYYPHSWPPPAYDECVRQVAVGWWQALPIGIGDTCSIGFRPDGVL